MASGHAARSACNSHTWFRSKAMRSQQGVLISSHSAVLALLTTAPRPLAHPVLRVRRRSLGGQVFPSSGPGQGRRVRAATSRSPKAILDAVLNLGITLRQANDGEVSILGDSAKPLITPKIRSSPVFVPATQDHPRQGGRARARPRPTMAEFGERKGIKIGPGLKPHT